VTPVIIHVADRCSVNAAVPIFTRNHHVDAIGWNYYPITRGKWLAWAVRTLPSHKTWICREAPGCLMFWHLNLHRVEIP